MAVSIIAFCLILGLIVAVFRRRPADAWRIEYHPTDSSGGYIPAGDSKLRMGRLFPVSDQHISWYRVGDTIKDHRGNARQITQVDCRCCYYCVAAEKGTVEPITFEEALRINGYPKRG
jgi:hypothetical protein